MVLKQFELALVEFHDGAIVEVSQRYAVGRDDRQDKQYGPSLAQFMVEIRRENGNWNGSTRVTSDEQRTRNIQALLSNNPKPRASEKTEASKKRVAAMAAKATGMGTGLPNFNTGTIEERIAKCEKFNREKQELKAPPQDREQ